MAVRGQWVDPIDDDMKEQFLELVATGHRRPEAAKALGASPRQFRSLCSPDSYRYDEDFARRYAKLTEENGEHEENLAERLEAAAIERAIRSSDPLLTKLLAIYHPNWKAHLPQEALRITNVNVEELRMLVPNLPDEALREIVATWERQKQLEAGEPE